MIVVDSSVWIDFLNGRNAPHVRRLRALLGDCSQKPSPSLRLLIGNMP